MEYVADTVTLVRHFSSGKVGRRAATILQEAEKGDHTIWVSVLSLVEIMYLSEKKRISLNLKEARAMIDESDNYKVISLVPDIIETAKEIEGLEIFDRLIVATAKYLGFPLLTSDAQIRERGGIEVIWA